MPAIEEKVFEGMIFSYLFLGLEWNGVLPQIRNNSPKPYE
jgi:hypothetical protein